MRLHPLYIPRFEDPYVPVTYVPSIILICHICEVIFNLLIVLHRKSNTLRSNQPRNAPADRKQSHENRSAPEMRDSAAATHSLQQPAAAVYPRTVHPARRSTPPQLQIVSATKQSASHAAPHCRNA